MRTNSPCLLTLLRMFVKIMNKKGGRSIVKISTEIGSASRLVGEQRAIEYIAKAGFDAWDFSMFEMCKYDYRERRVIKSDHPLAGKDYLKFAKKLRETGLDNGIVCNQSHAPFPTYCPEIRSHYERAIECTAEAGAKICIIHPDNYKSAEENAEIYEELIPFARSCNVKIATENMWCWNNELDIASRAACSHHDDFVRHIDVVNDEYFVACLDIGHAEMYGLETSAPQCIRALAHRLQALHIHDNDLRLDSHQIPFSMKIDFDAVVAALREINYSGDLTLEADAYLASFTAGDVSRTLEGIKNLADSAKKLRDMFNR